MSEIPTVNATASYDCKKSSGGRRTLVSEYMKKRPILSVRSYRIANRCVRLDIYEDDKEILPWTRKVMKPRPTLDTLESLEDWMNEPWDEISYKSSVRIPGDCTN